jgi:hypothetical protein
MRVQMDALRLGLRCFVSSLSIVHVTEITVIDHSLTVGAVPQHAMYLVSGPHVQRCQQHDARSDLSVLRLLTGTLGKSAWQPYLCTLQASVAEAVIGCGSCPVCPYHLSCRPGRCCMR